METQYSEDGHYWWDGEQWQPVESQSSQETTDEAPIEAIRQVGDEGAEPGDRDLLEELREYFEPDKDDVEEHGDAEVVASLDDSQFTGTEA